MIGRATAGDPVRMASAGALLQSTHSNAKHSTAADCIKVTAHAALHRNPPKAMAALYDVLPVAAFAAKHFDSIPTT